MKIVNRSLAAFAIMFVANIASQSFGQSMSEQPTVSAHSVMIDPRLNKS